MDLCICIAKDRIEGRCYEEAGNWLSLSFHCFKESDSIDLWKTQMKELCSKYSRRYTLMPILRDLLSLTENLNTC